MTSIRSVNGYRFLGEKKTEENEADGEEDNDAW